LATKENVLYGIALFDLGGHHAAIGKALCRAPAGGGEGPAMSEREFDLAWRKDKAEALLYKAIKELDYVQSVENCTSGLCASAEGKELIERGMKLLGVKDLSAETLDRAERQEQPK